MTPIVLWLFLATPRPACIDKAKHENLGECHEEEMTKDCYGWNGYYWVNCPDSSKLVTVCDQVPNPKPLPQEKTLLSTNRYAMRGDDCYEVRKTSFSMTEDVYTLFYGDTGTISTPIIGPASKTGKRK